MGVLMNSSAVSTSSARRSPCCRRSPPPETPPASSTALAELNPPAFLYPRPRLPCCSPTWKSRNESTATRVLPFFRPRPARRTKEARNEQVSKDCLQYSWFCCFRVRNHHSRDY